MYSKNGISLSNVIKRLESAENINSKTENNYKEAVDSLLDHFKEQLQVVNGEVIDPYSGIRPKLICKIN